MRHMNGPYSTKKGILIHTSTILRSESNLMVCDSSRRIQVFLSRILHKRVKRHNIVHIEESARANLFLYRLGESEPESREALALLGRLRSTSSSLGLVVVASCDQVTSHAMAQATKCTQQRIS